MHNLTVETKKIVTCNFSADQWELYTNAYPRDEIQAVADDLNRCLQDLADGDYPRGEALEYMHGKMKEYAKYGAYDSEPLYFLEDVLNEIYK